MIGSGDCFGFGFLKPNTQLATTETLRIERLTQPFVRADTSYQANDVTYIRNLGE